MTSFDDSALPSRRRLLQSAAVAAAVASFGRFTPAQELARDYTARALFDEFDSQWNKPMPAGNEEGALGWGRAWLMQAYVLMYQTYRDPHYLDRLIADFDQILNLRDSVRGVRDYRGLSLPGWRCVSDYTCGAISLSDPQNRPTLLLRTATRPADLCSVAVSAGSRPGTFKLTIEKSFPKKGATRPKPIVDVCDNLTMNPAGEDFAPRRINAEFARLNAKPRTMITAKDLRPTPDAACDPALSAAKAFEPLGYIYAVQVGQITYPVSAFVRAVLQTPELSANARLRAKADEYLDALVNAVDIFDYEWRQNETEGWYIWAKGAPNPFDGADQPHNQYLSLARTMMHLAHVAPDSAARDKYRDRATRMARTFKNDLKLGGNGAYSWPYFWSKGRAFNGWSAVDDVSDYQPDFVHPKPGGHKDVEDVSHGALDIEVARLAYKETLGVFDQQDLQRFAAAFTKNVLTTGAKNEPTVFDNVDGSGRKGTYDVVAACWAPLAAYDPEIFKSLVAIYTLRQPKPGPTSLPLGIASLNAFARHNQDR